MYNPYQYPQQPFYNGGAMPDQLSQLRGNYQNQPNMQPQQQNQPIQQSNMIWVTRKEAEDYIVGPNCSVSMWDKDENVAYIKSADSTGKPTMRYLDYTERKSTLREPPQKTNEDYVSRSEYDALSAQVEMLSAELNALKKRPAAKKVKEDEADA